MTTRALDIVMNLWTEEVTKNYPPELNQFWDLIRLGADTTQRGISLPDQLKRMDEAGIDKALLVATTGGDPDGKIFFEKPAALIRDTVAAHPQRFKGIMGLNPSRIMQGLEKLEQAVRDYGFVGAHLYPHWFGKAPDDRIYYPFYAKCAELNIPVQIQVGHSAQWFLETVGRPICLDKVAIHFPQLKIIGIHIGHPWTEEMISMAWKHPNVFIGSDAHAPRYWDHSLVQFINTRGQDKVLFGTDWPIIDMARAIKEIEALELRPEAQRKLLVDNAVRVYGLEQWL